MSNEGYIKIYRQIRDWKWYSDGPTKDVFLHLLVTASFEDKFYRGIAVKRGQSVLTVEEIREETGLTVRQIRTAINRLISTNEVTKQATYNSFQTAGQTLPLSSCNPSLPRAVRSF